MIRNVVKTAGIMTLAACSLLADFSYQEKSTVTGGAIAGMLKVAGVFSKQAREPIETTVSVKGDRMVTRSQYHLSIVDLNAQTITSVDLQKKTYTVMTFDEMNAMLAQMQQNMKNARNNDGQQVQMNFKVSANETGAKKEISGYNTKEMLLKMELEGTDQQTGQKGGLAITSDMWITPAIEGYGQVRDFHKRMAEKLNWTPGGNMFMARPEVSKGMAELYKEGSKIDGMPVQQTVVMGAPAQAGADGSAQRQQPQQSDAEPAAKPSFGGLLGGALGVQRNKKSSSDPQSSNGSQPGSLLEMTTVMSGFSSNAVDDSVFQIPAGFKKVQPDTRRMQ